MSRDRKYPLRLPAEDAKAVDAVCEESRVSFNRVVSLCVKQGLPAVRQSLSPKLHEQLRGLAPLSDKVLAASFAKMSAEEIAEDAQLGRASIKAQKGRK
jgi:hypothetical protein